MKLKFPPLGNRLLTVLGARGAAEAHSDRLRDVLGRDRALAVGARARTRASALGASAARSVTPVETSAVEAPAPTTAPRPVPSAAAAGSSDQTAELLATASAGSEERPQRVQHEPIRTRTMARLLAAQGYRQRALAIYEELLAAGGADETLRAEVEALRLRSA